MSENNVDFDVIEIEIDEDGGFEIDIDFTVVKPEIPALQENTRNLVDFILFDDFGEISKTFFTDIEYQQAMKDLETMFFEMGNSALYSELFLRKLNNCLLFSFSKASKTPLSPFLKNVESLFLEDMRLFLNKIVMDQFDTFDFDYSTAVTLVHLYLRHILIVESEGQKLDQKSQIIKAFKNTENHLMKLLNEYYLFLRD